MSTLIYFANMYFLYVNVIQYALIRTGFQLLNLDCLETGEYVLHFVRLEDKIGEIFGNKIVEYLKYIIDKHTLFISVEYSI
jgi:hypothetical protein